MPQLTRKYIYKLQNMSAIKKLMSFTSTHFISALIHSWSAISQNINLDNATWTTATVPRGARQLAMYMENKERIAHAQYWTTPTNLHLWIKMEKYWVAVLVKQNIKLVWPKLVKKWKLYFRPCGTHSIDWPNFMHHLLIDTAALLPLCVDKLSESVCCPTILIVLQRSSSS